MATWGDETAPSATWGDGATWKLGETGIWLGMPGLFLGVGYSYRSSTYSEEDTPPGDWSS